MLPYIDLVLEHARFEAFRDTPAIKAFMDWVYAVKARDAAQRDRCERKQQLSDDLEEITQRLWEFKTEDPYHPIDSAHAAMQMAVVKLRE
jgi:hypothetical protein